MARVIQSPASHSDGMGSIRGQIHMGYVAAKVAVGQVTLREDRLRFPPPTYYHFTPIPVAMGSKA